MKESPFRVVSESEAERKIREEEEQIRNEANRKAFMEQVEKFAKERGVDVFDVIHHYALYMGISIDELPDPKTKDRDIFTHQPSLNSYWEQISKDLKIEKLMMALAAAEKEASTDTLTGLPNRRASETKLREMIAAFNENKKNFSIIILDIDNFKGINDNFSHKIGDEVLIKVAETITALVRSDKDLAFRHGGEEMGVVVDGDLALATKIAEQIREGLHKIKITHPKFNREISASFGVTEYRDVYGKEIKESITGVVVDAYKAMSQAKEEGKDRVVTFEKMLK